MFDQSRATTPMNFPPPSSPSRCQYSRWSFDRPTLSASQSYFPYRSLTINEASTPNYVNYDSPSSLYERPKSTIVCDSITPNHQPSTFHVNDLRQRFESKAVVGIVKPMIHQRSQTELNSNQPHPSIKPPDMPPMAGAYLHGSLRSLPRPSHSPSPSIASSVVYRHRPATAQSRSHGPPPIVPRRYSSISSQSSHQNRSLTSHRSSRTTSTSSSIIALNEQEQGVDTKRLEMFYGSVGTLVKAARSIARLYTTTTRQLANFEDWSSQQIGVPLWIYNTVCLSLLSLNARS